MRKRGCSINEIASELQVSKSSVSLWVRDIELSAKHRLELTKRGFSVAAVEKRRLSRMGGTWLRHQLVIDRAKQDIKSLSTHELLLVGTALYWGEGNKASKNVAGLANSDPFVIKIMMKFFKEVCKVDKKKFRGHIHTFSHSNVEKAEKYWSKISGIPRHQFYKTYTKPSIASKGKKDSLPYGTLQVYVCDTTVALTIKGWIERLRELGVS